MFYDFIWSDPDPEQDPDPYNLIGSGSDQKVRVQSIQK